MNKNKPTTENTENTEIKEKDIKNKNSCLSVARCIQWLNSFII